MSMRSLICALAIGAVVVSSAAADAAFPRHQSGVPAPIQTARDQPGAAAMGTASVSGTVVADDDTSTPLRHVMLTLLRSGVVDQRVTSTDGRGRYLFTSLASGNYTLTASRGAYVSASYGASKVGLPGSPIPIADGQQFVAAPIRLLRGAIITGRVLDARGRPVSASVQVTQFTVVNGERRPKNSVNVSSFVQTDSRGIYRAYGLAPGDYLVSANTRTLFVTGDSDVRDVTPDEISWAEHELAQPGAPIDRTTEAALKPSQPTILAPTFYPGTTEASAAAVVTVGRAEERSGVDFMTQSVATARVSGVVHGPDGAPVGGAIVVRVQKNAVPFGVGADLSGTGRTSANGTFAFSGVTPGEYSIAVRGAAGTPGGRAGGAPDAGGLPTGAMPLWGEADVSVHGDDVSGLDITLQPGVKVSGTVVFDGTTLQPPDPSRIETRLMSMPGVPTISVNTTPTTAASDGTFEIPDVTPGLYRMTATAPSSPGATAKWTIKSATLDGKDVLDMPFEVGPGRDISGLTVTFSDRQTELGGTIVDASGKPAPQFYLLAFPKTKSLWAPGSRWIRSARAGLDGKYRIADLPPGDYYVCALTEIDNQQLFDPAYLEQFVLYATTITLGDGERRTLDLRVGGS